MFVDRVDALRVCGVRAAFAPRLILDVRAGRGRPMHDTIAEVCIPAAEAERERTGEAVTGEREAVRVALAAFLA